MILALAAVIVVLVSIAAIGHQLESAPEGFEDHRGFHFLTRHSGSPASGSAPEDAFAHSAKATTAASLI